jgi:hypothetical protein
MVKQRYDIWILLLLILVVSAPIKSADAEDSLYVRLADSRFWRNVSDLNYSDGHLFALFNSGLTVYKPLNRFWQMDSLATVPLSQDYQYCRRLVSELLCYSEAGQLAFVRVQPEDYPQVIAETSLPTEFEDLEYERLRLYLACGFDGLKIFDLTDRHNPALIAQLKQASNAVAVEKHGPLLYLVDSYNGIHLYDIASNPDHPPYLGKVLFYHPVVDFTALGQDGYCAYSDSGTLRLDLTDPLNPTVIAKYPTESFVSSVKKQGEYVFSRDVYGTFQIFHPDSSSVVANIENPGFFGMPVLVENRDGKFLAAVDSFKAARIYEVENGWGLKPLAEISSAGSIEDVVLHGGFAYVASGAGPLLIVKPDADGNLNMIERHPARADDLEIAGDYLFIADNYNRRIWITMMLEDGGLHEILSIPITIDIHSMSAVVAGDQRALLAFRSRGNIYLHEIELSLGSYHERASLYKLSALSDVHIDRDYLYYATRGGNGKAYDISDPEAIDFIDNINWGIGINELLFDGPYIYGVGNEGLRRYVLADGVPVFDGVENALADTLYDVELYEDFLVCGAKNSGLVIFEKDADSLIQISSYQTSGGLVNLALADSLLLAADDFSLLSYQLSLSEFEKQAPDEVIPERFRLAQNYPNPFNAETVIELDIPEAVSGKTLEVEIFNALGQKVRLLSRQVVSAGSLDLRWDGKADGGGRLASGIYFLRVKVGGIDEVVKMLLLK